MPLFPAALISCIREGRAPRVAEVEAVAQHIWDDAYRILTDLAWEMVDPQDPRHSWMMNVARLALCGAEAPLSQNPLRKAPSTDISAATLLQRKLIRS